MDARFWISGIVIAVLALAFGYFVHGTLLFDEYAKLPGLFRTIAADQESYFPYMVLAHVLFGFAFTWVYRQGRTPGASALVQGLRYGVAIAALVTIPTYLIYYAVQPVPESLVIKQILFDSISVVLLGVAVAFLNPLPAHEVTVSHMS